MMKVNKTFLPAQSSARSTLFAGEFSKRVTEGTLSPTATGAIALRWRFRVVRDGSRLLISLEMQCMSEGGQNIQQNLERKCNVFSDQYHMEGILSAIH